MCISCVFVIFDVYVLSTDSTGEHTYTEMYMLKKTLLNWKVVYSGGHSIRDIYNQVNEPGDIFMDYDFSFQLTETTEGNEKTYFGIITDETIQEIKFIVNNLTTQARIFEFEGKRHYSLTSEVDEARYGVIARVERGLPPSIRINSESSPTFST